VSGEGVSGGEEEEEGEWYMTERAIIFASERRIGFSIVLQCPRVLLFRTK
jgi:hypothetical protein